MEDCGIDRGQVDHHQRIQSVAEGRINAEAQNPGIQLQVLPQQDGHAFAVALGAGDKAIGFADRSRNAGETSGFPYLEGTVSGVKLRTT